MQSILLVRWVWRRDQRDAADAVHPAGDVGVRRRPDQRDAGDAVHHAGEVGVEKETRGKLEMQSILLVRWVWGRDQRDAGDLVHRAGEVGVEKRPEGRW